MSSFNQRGQTLVEYLIVKIILIFISFAVIEIARLYAFKSYLQILTHEFVVKLSNRHLELMKNNLFYKQNNMNNYQKKIESEVKKEIEFKLMKFVTANLSFDFNNKNSLLSVKEHKIALYLDFISKYSSQNTPGVYLKVNTCLPVLFSGFFRNYLDKKSESSQIGKRVAAKSTENHSESKNCLGLYTSNSLFEPLFWFRVRSSAFFPWPASSAIYQHGFAIPHKFKGLEQELKTDILKSIDENNLTLFFYKNSKEVL